MHKISGLINRPSTPWPTDLIQLYPFKTIETHFSEIYLSHQRNVPLPRAAICEGIQNIVTISTRLLVGFNGWNRLLSNNTGIPKRSTTLPHATWNLLVNAVHVANLRDGLWRKINSIWDCRISGSRPQSRCHRRRRRRRRRHQLPTQSHFQPAKQSSSMPTGPSRTTASTPVYWRAARSAAAGDDIHMAFLRACNPFIIYHAPATRLIDSG